MPWSRDVRQRAVQVPASLVVHAHPVRPRIGKRGNKLVGILDHQVAVQRQLRGLAQAFTTGGPIVILGTKCPSMMSTWITVPPPRSAAATSSAEVRKVRRKNRWKKFNHLLAGRSSIIFRPEAADPYASCIRPCPVSLSPGILAATGASSVPLLAGRTPAPRQHGNSPVTTGKSLPASILFSRIRPRARIAGVPLRLSTRSMSITSGSSDRIPPRQTRQPVHGACLHNGTLIVEPRRSSIAAAAALRTSSAAVRKIISARFHRSLFSVGIQHPAPATRPSNAPESRAACSRPRSSASAARFATPGVFVPEALHHLRPLCGGFFSSMRPLRTHVPHRAACPAPASRGSSSPSVRCRDTQPSPPFCSRARRMCSVIFAATRPTPRSIDLIGQWPSLIRETYLALALYLRPVVPALQQRQVPLPHRRRRRSCILLQLRQHRLHPRLQHRPRNLRVSHRSCL